MTPNPPSFRHALSNLTRPLCILDSESLLSHIFSATAASEGLGNPVARAS